MKQSREMKYSLENKIILHQLLKSTTSVGANYQEAQGAVSKADFVKKVGIALKEIRETKYWIKIILAISEKNEEWIALQTEAMELKNIVATIYNKIKSQLK